MLSNISGASVILNTMTACKIEDCEKPAAPKRGGLCAMHYTRKTRFGDPHIASLRPHPRGYVQAILRDAAASDTDECIIFSSVRNRYRTVTLNGRGMVAARAVWILTNGEISDGRFVLHSCNHGSGANGCINPKHLYLGTASDNIRDAHGDPRRKPPRRKSL